MSSQLTLYSPNTGWIVLRAIQVWVLISAIEVIHGVARVTLLAPLIGDFPARQVGVLSGSLLIVGIAFLFHRWMGMKGARECLLVGGIWVLLTIVFEILLGKLVLQVSWSRLLDDYDILHGGLMPLGLVVMFTAPLIVWRFDRRKTK
jgi:hypothetical protein